MSEVGAGCTGVDGKDDFSLLRFLLLEVLNPGSSIRGTSGEDIVEIGEGRVKVCG